jgi:hypothetical protein
MPIALVGSALVVVLVAVVVAAVRSRPGPGCVVPPPVPNLPAALRALGGYDQPMPTEPATLKATATQIATTLYPDLRGAVAGDPVLERAVVRSRPDALVVPLHVPGEGAAPGRIEGLVAFLLDCQGRAYYSDTRDLLRTTSSLPEAYPSVPRQVAEAQLGSSGLELVYDDDPFSPRWRDRATGRDLPARASLR